MDIVEFLQGRVLCKTAFSVTFWSSLFGILSRIRKLPKVN